MHAMRIRLLLVLALLVAACSTGTEEPTTSTSTIEVEVTSPNRLLAEWVPADLRPGGLLIGDTLTVAGDRYVVFEEIDGRQVAVWTSEDGRSWSPGDDSAFPPGAHVLRVIGNEHGAIAVGWSGQPAWPPDPEFPPVFDRVWTTTDGLVWTPGQLPPVLVESTEYLEWYVEMTSALAHEAGFLLVGQVRWFIDGAAIADEMGLEGDIVVYPSPEEAGGCTLEGVYRDGERAFTVPCAEYGIDPDADGLFLARPPVVVAGNREGFWEVLDTIGLDTVSIIDAGVGPDGVSLFSWPSFDAPRYWTSVDLQAWQTVEGIPGIDAEAVFSMRSWRDGWVADIGFQDVEGGELWWTRLGSTWKSAGVEGQHGRFAVGRFGLVAVTAPVDAPDSTELWFTPDGVKSAVFNVADLFGPDAATDGLAVGVDSVVAVVSTFDESAEYPWVARVWVGVPLGE
jgi:hypothetical protein